MIRLGLPIVCFIGPIGAMVAEWFYYYGQLPDRLATHFDVQGNPDGWTLKEDFGAIAAGLLVLTTVVLWIMPLAIWLLPASALNLPRKQYWLDTARFPTARQMIVLRACWFNAGTMVFLAYLWHEMLQSNLQPRPQLEFAMPLGCYLAFTLLWCAEMYWAFNRPPRESERRG